MQMRTPRTCIHFNFLPIYLSLACSISLILFTLSCRSCSLFLCVILIGVAFLSLSPISFSFASIAFLFVIHPTPFPSLLFSSVNVAGSRTPTIGTSITDIIRTITTIISLFIFSRRCCEYNSNNRNINNNNINMDNNISNNT